ncbi:hypothetical protein GH714_022165 [Hevea brasiliensis]|uniref:Uncharacterized protein n=1 Tax=Hevea brasiliensis TaxID=3981 RepID=A0A6A6KQJ1_HEVBR|nr:hypothetical protein GH714_022165 [Hevea brasiliensis]
MLLEVPEYPDQELLFLFKDGLQAWARLEVERRGAPNLVATITIAESLIEYKRSDKTKNKDGKNKSGGEKGGSKEGSRDGPKEGNGGKKQWSGKKNHWGKRFGKSRNHDNTTERGPLKCYNCQGPHLARDCPKNGALDARVVENENPPPRQEGSSMGSMQLGTIGTGKQTKVQLGNKGRLFAQIQVGQNEVQALVDTGATDNFLRLEEAQKLAQPPPGLLERISEGLQHDPQARLIGELVAQGKTRRFWQDDQGLLRTKRGSVFVPRWGCLRKEVMQECHHTKWAGHPGA